MRALLLIPALAWLAACQRLPDPPEKTGELIVLTRTSPVTYYLNADKQPVGFEYDLARQFADKHGWRLRLENADSLDAMMERLKHGEAHLAAAGLAITPARRARLRFGPVYAQEHELLICAEGLAKPKSVADLVGLRIEVVAGSSHLERLHAMQAKHAQLAWHAVQAASEETLLERVASGLADCAVADALSYEVARNFLPALAVAMDLGARDIAWALPEWADEDLRQEIDKFFAEAQRLGTLKQLRERYFGHVSRLEQADALGILEKRGQLLPALKRHFFQAQLETGIDWRLLAALAYQESQWDKGAVSPTGVRGIMMLTGDTADRMGVSDRLNPRESILGGARYLAMLRNEMPDRIQEPDRTWMAMAAYNQGMGHLEDARRLAQRLGKNPDRWSDLKQVLPLIARSEYLPHLRHGFARGGEAATLAENVRIYYDILQRYETAYDGGFEE